jgi:uncharacterized protein YicC (UPF0701 family)
MFKELIEKKQKELLAQFEDMQKKEKEVLDQLEKINAIRVQIREELLRLQGEYRGFEKIRLEEGGGKSESGEGEVNEASGRSSKIISSARAGKSG